MFLKYAQTFCATPIAMKSSEGLQSFQVLITPRLVFAFEFFIFELFLYMCFLLVQIYRVKYFYPKPDSTVILSFTYVVLLCTLLTLTVALQIHRKREELANVFVAWLGFLQKIKSKF